MTILAILLMRFLSLIIFTFIISIRIGKCPTYTPLIECCLLYEQGSAHVHVVHPDSAAPGVQQPLGGPGERPADGTVGQVPGVPVDIPRL